MSSYAYVARDMSGARKQGQRQAACSTAVVGWLREQGLTPVEVSEISEEARQSRPRLRGKRVRSADLAAFCWQLSTMVEGGVPVTTALETIGEDAENTKLKGVLGQMLEVIREGGSLSDSVAKFPRIFNDLARGVILAGEAGGNLAAALRKLAEYFDNRDRLTRKVKGAAAYPVFVFTFITVIVILIMTLIVPRFRMIFAQIGADLPAFTKAFLGCFEMVANNLVYIVGSVVFLTVFGVLAYTKSKKGRHLFCRLALSLPLLGKLFSQAFFVVFCRTMATLLATGVSVLEVFDVLLAMTGNDVIKEAIAQTREHIVEGSSVSVGMSRVAFFPNMVVTMIRAGEESGSLTNVLDRTADYYERKVDSTITMVAGMLEPIMIVTIGAVVAVIILALYLPIFSISNITK